MVYGLILIYLFVNAVMYDVNSFYHRRRNLNIFLSYLILALVAGMRYKLGSDGFAYEYLFETEVKDLANLDFDYFSDSRNQPIWDLLQSTAKSFGSFLFLQLFVSFFAVFSVYFFLRKNTPYVSTVTLLFYVAFYHYFTVEILKESLAISLFLFAMTFFRERKTLSFILCVISFFVHQFALITLVIYFLLRLNLSFKAVVLTLLVFAWAIFIFQEPLEFIAVIFSVVKSVDLSNLYLDVNLSGFGYLLYFIKILLPILLVYYCHSRKLVIASSIDNKVFYTFCAIISCFYIIRITSVPYFERVINYFEIFYLLIGAFVVISFLRRQELVIRNIVFSWFIFSTIIFSWAPLFRPDPTTGIPGYVRYYPYYSHLNPAEDPRREVAVSLRFSL